MAVPEELLMVPGTELDASLEGCNGVYCDYTVRLTVSLGGLVWVKEG